MKTKILLLLHFLAVPAARAEVTDSWREIGGNAVDWKESLPIWNKDRAVLVLDAPARTRLRAVFLPDPFPGQPVEVGRMAKELLHIFKNREECALTIDWLDGIPAGDHFRRSLSAGDGRVRSVSRIGTTTITRTVLGSRENDAVFIHLIADHPGALSFKVTLGAGPSGKIRRVDRRQLILIPETGPASHVWVLPFESDVEPDGDSITVRGEGEALIIWSLAASGAAPDVMAKLAKRHDPGHSPPDPTKIWQGVLAGHLKSAENSP